MMKILVAGPESDDCLTHNVAHTFRSMGHTVLSEPSSFGITSRSRVVRKLNATVSGLSSRFDTRRERWLLKTAREFKPELTMVCTATLEPDYVEAIRVVSGGKVVCWYCDSPAHIRRNHIVSGEYDAVFIKDLAFAKILKNMLNLNAHHLQEAFNPDWHKPLSTKQVDYILVAGNLYGYRSSFLKELITHGETLKIFGLNPPLWAPTEVKQHYTGIFLNHLNKAEYFGQALACLNTFSPAERESLNCRIFETCGCGGLLLSENKPCIGTCFDPDVEFAPFESFEECLEQIAKFRCDEFLAQKMRLSASKRSHAEHTYQHRLTAILDIVGMTVK